MTRRICLGLFAVLAVLVLTACSSSPSNSKADNLVKAYITAYEAKNTEQILSLFSEDAIYMDQGNPGFRATGEMYVRNIRTSWSETFLDPLFNVKFASYFISNDGTSAALKTDFNYKNSKGNPASAPMMIILELKDGKIVREDDYYDYTPFE